MVLKNVTFCIVGAALAVSSAAMAAEYQPDDFFTLDLTKAVLSPTPLGPAMHFVPVPLKAKGDGKSEGTPDGETHASQARVTNKVALREERPAHLRTERPRGFARARLAHRHRGNPLDAMAMDRRIQVWPCRSGGICNWKPVPGER